MGGDGSGRKPSEATIVKRMVEVRTPIANDIFLPDYSGVAAHEKTLNKFVNVSGDTMTGALTTTKLNLTDNSNQINFNSDSASNIDFNVGSNVIGTSTITFFTEALNNTVPFLEKAQTFSAAQTFSGAVLGCRMLYTFGRAASSTGNQNLQIGGVTLGAGQGLVLARPGSIVGMSLQTNISLFVSSGTLTCEVMKNDTAVFSVALSITGTGIVSNSGTQTRNVDTFVAGDILRMRMTLDSGSYTFQDTLGCVELQFDT